MKLIAHEVRKALLFLVTGFLSVVVAACYGMVYTFQAYGRVLDRDTGAPLPNIKVRCADASGVDRGVAYTDAGGNWSLDLAGHPAEAADVTFTFADVDGDANGGDHGLVTLPGGPELPSGGAVEMPRK